VRRLTALVITIGLTWLVVSRFDTTGGSAALALGVALIAASIVGWLCEFARLPRITGYLAFGLVCGPSLLNIINESMARDLQAANGFAIIVIALLAGLRLNLRALQLRLPLIATLSGVTLVGTWLALGALLFALWPWLPIAPELAIAQRLAAAAITATLFVGASPAVAIAVVADSRARGPLAELSIQTVVAMEIGLPVLFMLCLEGTRIAFGVPAVAATTLAGSTAWALIGSVAFGALMGALFTFYLRYVGRELTVVLIALCAMLSVLAAQMRLDPLLVGLTAGVVVQNVITPAANVLYDAIEQSAMPVLVLFFAAVGASIHVEVLATVGVVALGVTAARLWVIRGASRLAGRLAGADTPEARLLWRAFVPTAGVTLTLALIVAVEYPEWGGRLQALIVAVVALNQLIGPIIFRASLVQAKEIGGTASGLVVVSNREPWAHDYAPDGSIVVRPTPGGVSVALDALMRERGGVWIAHGAGTADHVVVDDRGSIDVPPEAPAYRLRRLWMTSTQYDRYYAGFSNSALWPLCHQAHVKPIFKEEDWQAYQDVNRMFADAVAIEAPPDASVFLNDYHLAMVAGYVRERRPQLRTALFWHIPWPDIDRLRICPQRRDLLQGLLSNDLLAFQLQRDQKNFLNAVADEFGGAVSGETVYLGSRTVRVVAIPIGADFDRITEILADPQLPDEMRRLSTELGLDNKFVGIGVDRLDYTKGIPERIAAIERLLDDQPGLASQFVFVQVGVPSRSDVPEYAKITAEIEAQVAAINIKHGRSASDGPIRYLAQSFQLPQLVALYRIARFCIVSSLHDGMNLVAKEFVAARDDHDGVLILSELAGAAQELHEALIINPYDERGFTEAIARAIGMPAWERRRRMQALRRRVAGRDVLAWASDILDRLERRKGQGFLSG
jgi:trehalose 6-phosphate synthase